MQKKSRLLPPPWPLVMYLNFQGDKGGPGYKHYKLNMLNNAVRMMTDHDWLWWFFK